MIRDNAEQIIQEVRRLGIEIPVEVTDTRLRQQEEFRPGVLYLGQAESGIGVGPDGQRQMLAAIGRFFGRYNERTAMGSSVQELLTRLGWLAAPE